MAVLYLASASGAGVHLHYCMDKLVEWSIFQSDRDVCGFCGMEKKESSKKSCCKDLHHSSKVDKAQKTNTQNHNFELAAFIIPQAQPVDSYMFALTFQPLKEARGNAPPILPSQPIFIKNCTYRI